MHHQKTAWNDFFPNTSTTNFESQTYTSKQSVSSDTAIYVSNCLFKSCTSSGDGGALYCGSSLTYLLVESTSFFKCTTSNTWGGAICFFISNRGNCVLYGVCGKDCCSINTGTSYGQFALIRVQESASNKNYANYSSVSRCVNEVSDSQRMFYLLYGKVCCTSVNLSMNKCYHSSGFYCIPIVESSSVTCSLLYSSFVDNSAFGYNCIRIDNGGSKNEIKSCNILRNTQISTSYATIYTNGILNIDESCILENIATSVFYSTSSSYPITLMRCTVDKTTNNGFLTIRNTVTKSFILGLFHLSTQNCNSDYDSVEYQNIFPLASHSAKESFCSCYTCNENYYQGRISTFFSITWMLFVTFGDC
jgi:hypothetical protein